MKKIWITLLILLILAASMLAVSCGVAKAPTGLLTGGVTIGPVTPVEVPGQTTPVPSGFFTSRKVLVYDASGKNLLQQVAINQIAQTANGCYAVQLAPGTYVVNVATSPVGGASGVPKTIVITAGQTVTVDINIDTGIR